MDLVDLLKRSEGKTLEFKRDLSTPDGALKTIVAFANTAGGTLLLGVEDRSRHVRGVLEPLDFEERLANLISDSIVPRLMPELEILPWRRPQVLAVQVHPSPTRPHHLKREGPDDGVYVRVGSTNRRADRALIDELRRFARGEGFDEQPLPGVGGMLLFGRDRERHFPDAWIQAGRFQGADKSRIVDHAEIRSYPVRAIEEAIGFVQKHAFHGADIGAVRRKERWNLPPVVVREAVINAVAHTDYAQRGGMRTSSSATSSASTSSGSRTGASRIRTRCRRPAPSRPRSLMIWRRRSSSSPRSRRG